MTTTKSANESTVTVGDTQVQMFSGGSGPDLLYLHGAGGNAGWQPFHEELARTHKVYAPSLPGFNGTPRPAWVSNITDLSHFIVYLTRELGLSQYVLVGSSMGGWVAAETAAMSHTQLKGLVLIGAVGIKPQKGEIAEIFMVGGETRLKLRFHDTSQVANYDQFAREMTPEEAATDHSNREMASRLCWRPYMHNPSLPHYLKKVDTPALVVWGKQDAIVPVECAELYQQALGSASVKIIDNCGHSPQVEKPQEFQKVVGEFLGGLK
jgi:pimeloyl-ACP methyl ester carboxylesterase